jgi:integrase
MRRDLPPYIQRDKRGVLYFVKRRPGDKYARWTRLETQFPAGDAVPFALHQERERLLSNPKPAKGGSDVAAVIRHYRSHPKFKDLAPRTRSDYVKHLDYITAKMGHLEPRQIERRHAISWLDAWAKKETPHAANYRLAVLKIVLEHAIDMGLLPVGGNAAKNVRKVKYEKQQRAPWPTDMVAAFRATADADTLLLFELLIGTGQRIGDVLKMRWSDYDGQAISVTQSKTGAKLWLPCPPRLTAALSATQRRPGYILTNLAGNGPLSYRSAAWRILAVRKAIGAMDYDIHSLRYTAAAELAAMGHDDDTIAAITGHTSKAMVVKYTGAARQIARAKKARGID